MAKEKSTSKKNEKKPKKTTEKDPDEKVTTKPATESKESTSNDSTPPDSDTHPGPAPSSDTPPGPAPSSDGPTEPSNKIIMIDNKMMIDMVKDGLNTKRKLIKELQDQGVNYDEEQFDAKLNELSYLQAIIRFKKGQYWCYVPRPVKPLCYHCGFKKCRFTRLRRKNFPRMCQKLQFIE